jgi:hypothetical protein
MEIQEGVGGRYLELVVLCVRWCNRIMFCELPANEKMFVVMMTRDARQRCDYRYLVRDLVHQVLPD